MKIVFHEKYLTVYSADPAAARGRLDTAVGALRRSYELIEPKEASVELLRLNHSEGLISHVKEDVWLYKVARLAVGGAVLSADLAVKGEPSFALIRPPGHHAGPDSYWGFCYFNNIAIAVKKLLKEGKIERALIIDFDLHFGDGTANSFAAINTVTYHHPEAPTADAFVSNIQEAMHTNRRYNLLGVSAGFDRGVHDWGGMLTDKYYTEIGKILRGVSEEGCEGRRFAVLEGGYNHRTLGKSIASFLKGFG